MDIAHFSGKDILEMAIRIEENGIQFYTQAGSASKSERLKELFLFLAEEEKRHIAYFEEIRRHIKDDTLTGVFGPNIEKDSSLFYYELQNAIRDKDKTTLKSLIIEEKSHLKKLTELQKTL